MHSPSSWLVRFAELWRETVANAKEHRIRDQAAFNMLTKVRPPTPLSIEGSRVERLFSDTAGADEADFRLAVLPLSRFLNGRTPAGGQRRGWTRWGRAAVLCSP